MSSFRKLNKKNRRLRLHLSGPSGSGKSTSALKIATGLAEQSSIYMLDTENSNDIFEEHFPEVNTVVVGPPYSPEKFLSLMTEAEKLMGEVIIIDSGTHFWKSGGGLLDMVEDEKKRIASRTGKDPAFYTQQAWQVVTPIYNKIINKILTSPAHIIFCTRAKEHVEISGGKSVKHGFEAEWREGLDFEVDFAGMMNMNHDLVITKARDTKNLIRDKIFHEPGPELAKLFLEALVGQPAHDKKEVESRTDAEKLLQRIADCSTEEEIQAVISDITTQFPDKEVRKQFNQPVVDKRRELQKAKVA